MAIVLPGEIRDALPAIDPDQDVRRRVYLIERERLASLWDGPIRAAGARLVIDVSTAAAALWRWLSDRRLMDDSARLALIEDTALRSDEPGFKRVMDTASRKY